MRKREEHSYDMYVHSANKGKKIDLMTDYCCNDLLKVVVHLHHLIHNQLTVLYIHISIDLGDGGGVLLITTITADAQYIIQYE